jgi:hypothetical protein
MTVTVSKKDLIQRVVELAAVTVWSPYLWLPKNISR